MRRLLIGVPALVAVLLATGCTATTPDGGGTAGSPTASPAPTMASPPSRSATPGVTPTELPTGTPVTGEVPAGLLAEIVADAASRSGVAQSDIVVVRGESVTWSDGSLGCPQPGMNYTQALVPGYWVVLDADGTEYDYRASARGSFTLCEGGGSPPLGSLDR